MRARLLPLLALAACPGGQRRAPKPAPSPSPPAAASAAGESAALAVDLTTTAPQFQVDQAAAAACKERADKLAEVDDFKPNYSGHLEVARCFYDAGAVGAALTLWKLVQTHARSDKDRLAAANGLVDGYALANEIEPGQYVYHLADAHEGVARVNENQVVRDATSRADALEHLQLAYCLRLTMETPAGRDAADQLAKRIELGYRRPRRDLDAFCPPRRPD